MIKIFFSFIYSLVAISSMLTPPPGHLDMTGRRMNIDLRCMVPASALAASSMPAGQCSNPLTLPPLMPINGQACASDFSMNPTTYCQARTQNYHCIHCNSFQPQVPSFNLINSNSPWYHNYAQMRWPNYNRPFIGSQHYADHHFYPGSGNVAVGKPNVYVHGTLLGRQRLQIKMKNDSNLLAASPVHGDEGWIFQKNKKELIINDAKYSYLYYDFKAPEKYLQNKEGFCGNKRVLYERMVSILDEMGFKKKEVKDFEDYWSVKFPGGDFCVYPQTHAELQKLAEWNGSFMPSGFKRVVFVSVPKLEKVISKHFTNEPEKDWNPVKGIYRVPASKNDIAIHEWGVAFLTDKKQ